MNISLQQLHYMVTMMNDETARTLAQNPSCLYTFV